MIHYCKRCGSRLVNDSYFKNGRCYIKCGHCGQLHRIVIQDVAIKVESDN